MSEDPRDPVAAYVGQETWSAIRDWQLANGYIVTVPAAPWRSSDGYSGASLLDIVVNDHVKARRLLIKSIPPQDSATFGVRAGREPARHGQAYVANDAFGRAHLVEQPFPALLTSGNWVVMFQSLAGNGVTCSSLRQLPASELGRACAVVVRSLIRDWNATGIQSRCDRVGDLLAEETGQALNSNGTIAAWAKQARLYDVRHDWIRLTDGGEVLPNPLLPACARVSYADEQLDVLRGRVHGDLHLLNVLLPHDSFERPRVDDFQLIDLATFSPSGSLTHDPVLLLLSAVATSIEAVSDADRRGLIDAILAQTPSTRTAVPFAVVTAIREAFRESVDAVGTGWSGTWHRQYLLSVQALALVFTRFTRLTGPVREWFFHLASHAAAAVAREYKVEFPTTATHVTPRFDDARGG